MGTAIGALINQRSFGIFRPPQGGAYRPLAGLADALRTYAWNEFSIDTPQRILAYLSQSAQETSFRNMRESLRYSQAATLARVFSSSFSNSASPGAVNDQYRRADREDSIFKRPFSFPMAPRTWHATRVSLSLEVAEFC